MSDAAAKRKDDLRMIAAETQSVLPVILAQIPSFNTTVCSMHHSRDNLLGRKYCPGFPLPGSTHGRKGTRVRVYDGDTFEVALRVQPGTTVNSLDSRQAPPVAVLNLANETTPGGGWLNGALAQEEALCYRSSLSLSLHSSHYPIPTFSALYSPRVLLIRDAMANGHDLLYPNTAPWDLPVFGVISLAALKRPVLSHAGKYFANREDRRITKEKIRVVLRVSVRRGHTKIVLGALGCGAFGNPPEEVAQCFKEVFTEDEFTGGWWEDVVFAVLDNERGDQGGKEGSGNFGIFYRALDGLVV